MAARAALRTGPAPPEAGGRLSRAHRGAGIEIDKAPFQAAMKPVYDKFITDDKLKSLVKRVQDTK